MKNHLQAFLFTTGIIFSHFCLAQNFSRTELPTPLTTPWEILYGPDNYLWLTESGGTVVRVDPLNGNKTVVFTAPDYFSGSPLEQLQACHQPDIGQGTLGLALHPAFGTAGFNYIYFVYSYNQGTVNVPATKFKIKRLSWDPQNEMVSGDSDIVVNLPNGYDHFGGRLLAVHRNSNYYLFFAAGDLGISETNAPNCYTPPSTNPNNFTQDPAFLNGKIHRYFMDGSIPPDNPVPGNPFYTRGHRNPQGLLYNADDDILFSIEHGDRTDDEINLLIPGMNYGWKDVRGYHADNNFAGESAYISGYVPHPLLANDSLVEAFYSWCNVPQPASGPPSTWCTVAPSDGIYYNSNGIPQWTKSLLVVTLKDGAQTDQELYQFKLNPDGKSLAPSLPNDSNPKRFFGADQALNGRLRDIAVSPNGTSLYLINNFGAASDKITVYTYTGPSTVPEETKDRVVRLFPNPAEETITLEGNTGIRQLIIYHGNGRKVLSQNDPPNKVNIQFLPQGFYYAVLTSEEGTVYPLKFIKK
ncbi:MAG: PQQ-dependent sugar dehydrogenase [Bacteroidia bacterium]|nr:PQQ-dependent sugar dehydrogenase [Bacteroidia bacterium]